MGILWDGTAKSFEITAKIMRAEGFKEFLEHSADDFVEKYALKKFTGPFANYRAKNEIIKNFKSKLKSVALREKVEGTKIVFKNRIIEAVGCARYLSTGSSTPYAIVLPRFFIDSVGFDAVISDLRGTADFETNYETEVERSYFYKALREAIHEHIVSLGASARKPVDLGEQLYLVGVEDTEAWKGEIDGSYTFLGVSSFDKGIISDKEKIEDKMKLARAKRASATAIDIEAQIKSLKAIEKEFLELRDWHEVKMNLSKQKVRPSLFSS